MVLHRLPALVSETTTAGNGLGGSVPDLSPQVMAIIVVAVVVLVFGYMHSQRSKD